MDAIGTPGYDIRILFMTMIELFVCCNNLYNSQLQSHNIMYYHFILVVLSAKSCKSMACGSFVLERARFGRVEFVTASAAWAQSKLVEAHTPAESDNEDGFAKGGALIRANLHSKFGDEKILKPGERAGTVAFNHAP